MAQKVGRHISYKTDEIMMIIDQYVRYTEGKSLFSASEVARFAVNELQIDAFTYYTITRNPDTKKYMEDTNKKIKNYSITRSGTPLAVFKTIDIEALVNMTSQQLRTALLNLNTMIEDTSDKHAKVIQENMKLSRQCAPLRTEVDRYKKELDDSINKAKLSEVELKEVIKRQKAEIAQLESILHIAWDKEAEAILKEQHIFESDNTKIDKKKTITDPTSNLRKVVNIAEMKKNSSESNVIDVRNGFLQGFEDL